MVQWIECRPENQKITSSIPSQGTCLGCRPGPRVGVCERQLIDVSLTHDVSLPFFSLPSPVSKK